MTTEINGTNVPETKNNAASQTLFRFVSLRNPQLTETIEDNFGFIFRPDNLGGVFDTAIENWSSENGTKFNVLEGIVKQFTSAFKSESEIEKSSFANLLELGRMIAKKENLDGYGKSVLDAFPKLENEDQEKLWNNLIYQVVTQENFYVKEAIVQILKALHYIKASHLLESDLTTRFIQINGKDFLNKALEAKVVLPAKLFLDDENNDDHNIEAKPFIVNEGIINKDVINLKTKSLSPRLQSKLDIDAQKQQELSVAKYMKSSLETLKSELEKLQKYYAKSYHKDYQNAYAEYQKTAQPIIEKNEKILNDLEATFDANTTESAKKTAYKTLELAVVPNFEFSYKNEINFHDLRAKLSPSSFGLFLKLFSEYDKEAFSELNASKTSEGAEFPLKKAMAKTEPVSDNTFNIEDLAVTLNEDYASYADVFAKINEEITAQSKTALSVMAMPQKQYVNLGGALVPVSTAAAKSQNLLYTLNPYSSSELFWGFGSIIFNFQVEDSSWSVASGKITLSTDNNSYEKTFSQIAVANNVVTLPNIFTAGFATLISIKIEIFFDNGKETVLELQNIPSNTICNGYLSLKGSSSNPKPFSPKHFGVKRLGIADYLKVEQSVHAYVPGEVSNIENVMASELRHKSVNEVTRTEDTTTTTKSQEVEKVSDTTKVDRTDVQTEVAKELDRQQSFEAHTRVTGKAWNWSLEVGGSYANNTAQHDSTRQAVAKSQEITERAMERVVTKISEERIQKLVHEVTLQNVHEFDNRGNGKVTPQHITGVYRWVDKKMKNQIYNYGKRTMFEFMIPEPARLHRLALKSTKNVLTAPQDPRTAAPPWLMKDANVDESILQHWADIYGEKLTETPPKSINHHIDYEWFKLDGNQEQRFKILNFPENYAAKSVTVYYGYEFGWMKVSDFKGGDRNLPYVGWNSIDGNFTVDDINIENNFAFKYQGFGVDSFNVTFDFICKLSDTYIASWKQTNFDAIIAGYTQAKADFEKAQADLDAATKADEAANKEKISSYYRDMEAEVLKHNCIAYLLQDYMAIGKDLTNDAQTMADFAVNLGDDLDAYTSLAKFMEQAMEWSVMDYTFYPYYWGNGENWQEMYLSEDLDPLFRSFLQAGMARVIVTVKPGFEDAVQFFMSTGRIWNGGEVPVIGDPMYLSIVDEMREPTGIAQGKYWITRVPTSLTILQARSVGLEVVDALPIFPEHNPSNCENPRELETVSAFGKPIDAVMQHGGETSTLFNYLD